MCGSKSARAQQKQNEQLRKEVAEMKSRHEVAQSRLEDAFVENHSLVEALKKREAEESQMAEEVNVLREQLQRAEALLQQQQEQGSQQHSQPQSQASRFKQHQHISGNHHRSQR